MISSEQIYTEIEVAESQLHEVSDTLLLLHSQYTHQWGNLQNSLAKIRTSLQNGLRELKSREEHLNLVQKAIEDRQKELKLRENQFNSAERFVCDVCGTLGVKVSEYGNVVVKIEPSTEFIDDCMSEDASVKLFVTMDGKTLQMFLNDRFDEHIIMREEVKNALKLSNDPVKLVLDALEGFFQPHLKKGKLEYEGTVVRSSCVLLLEQLMELKPRIKTGVREEARALAGVWVKKVEAEKGNQMVVLGFLLLVAVCSLWSDFDKYELGSLCEVVRPHRVADELNSRLVYLQECGVSYMASPFQRELPNTPPVEKEVPYIPPVLREAPYNPPVQKETPYIPVQKEAPYTPVQKEAPVQKDVPDILPVQKEAPYSPSVQNEVRYPSVQKKVSYTPVTNTFVSPVQKEAPPYNSPVQNEVRYPSVQKKVSYTPVKNTFVSPVQKEVPYIPSVQNEVRYPSVQKKVSYTPVKNTFVSPFGDPSIELCSICRRMDASGLKSYLIKHAKDLMLFQEKVLDCLQYASDPAKLVFDVVQDFYLELDAFQGDNSISCAFLLDQLMKLSLHITSLLKEECLNFAARWKARLAMESSKPFLIFGFLKFVAAYRLSNSIPADEILSLFTLLYEKDDIYESEQIPTLCRALGLEAKIPDLIRSLIKENKRLEAVRYTCAFNLADKFPPVPLLKEYLEDSQVAALKTCENFNNSIKAQKKCAKKQIRALQSVIRCIFDFKLDMEYSPIGLQQRIRQLEQENEERKSLLKLGKEKKGKKKKSAPTVAVSQSDSKDMNKRSVGGPTLKILFLGHTQEKRPRTDNPQNSVFRDVSTAVASSMNSLDPPPPGF